MFCLFDDVTCFPDIDFNSLCCVLRVALSLGEAQRCEAVKHMTSLAGRFNFVELLTDFDYAE
eukprot:scaffold407233_cov23-Prasinocladus_malaysianus.AAC.1